MNSYATKDGVKYQIYGCRGQGEKYKLFWQSFFYKPVWERVDFPWSYFALTSEDEVKFLDKWKNDIKDISSDKEYIEEIVEPDANANAMNKILAEEIQKEINKTIIDTICFNAKV